MSLVQNILDGDRLSLARLLTQIENDTAAGREALSELFPLTGHAHLIGVTGAPGTGKSSLVTHLVRYFRNTTVNPISKIGVVAVDPSSPFSGGAILGDRIRMRDLAGDPGVFIRSMASRGTLGGLATATSGIVQVLDAAGFEKIFIETVGAGQAEVDIARLAHTTLVVEAPGLGDDIQAIKAGILEIADILVVNKADRPGVESTERALQGMLQLAQPVPGWIAPIQRTVATTGDGISELAKYITEHYEYLQASGELYHRDRARIHSDVEILLRESLLQRWRRSVDQMEYENTLGRVFGRQISPWEAVEELINGGPER